MNASILAPLRVLQILQKYSDENHKVTQNFILDKLSGEYGIVAERKRIGQIVKDLQNAGYDICSTKKGCYIVGGDFENCELKFLLDSVLFSKQIPIGFANDLIEKLKNLGSVTFRERENDYPDASAVERTLKKSIFSNIEAVSEAISENKTISFTYNDNYTEKYTVYPLSFISKNNGYYLVAETVDKRELFNFEVVLIDNVEVQEKAKSIPLFDLNDHLSQNPYTPFRCGETITATVKIHAALTEDCLDKFGNSCTITRQDGETSIAIITAAETDVFKWAKENGEKVEILLPQNLRNKLRAFAKSVAAKYNKKEEDIYYSEIYTAKERKSVCLVKVDLNKRDEDYERLEGVENATFIDNNLEDFDFLEKWENLKCLTIRNNPVCDLTVLNDCENLIDVTITDTKIKSIDFIKRLEKLRSITLINNEIADFSPIYACKNLARLSVNLKSALSFDLKKLKECCPHLKIQTPEIRDVRSNLQRIFALEIYQNRGGIKKVLELFETFGENSQYGSENEFTEEEKNAALDFLNGKSVFAQREFFVYMHEHGIYLNNIKAEELINWLISTDRIKKQPIDSFIEENQKSEEIIYKVLK